jgi:hypothetical protein
MIVSAEAVGSNSIELVALRLDAKLQTFQALQNRRFRACEDVIRLNPSEVSRELGEVWDRHFNPALSHPQVDEVGTAKDELLPQDSLGCGR